MKTEIVTGRSHNTPLAGPDLNPDFLIPMFFLLYHGTLTVCQSQLGGLIKIDDCASSPEFQIQLGDGAC